MSTSLTVTINGRTCTGQAGQTILEVATANQIYIPTLCWMKDRSPWGGCRVCIVEVAGSPKVVPACSTPAQNGSVITTHSERLVRLRRMTIELLFSERNHICPICPMNNGDCGLQHQGYLHGVDSIRYPYLYPALPMDVSGPFFGLDHNRCILCTRCVRTCDEIEGTHTLDIAHRGEKNLVVVDLNATFGSSTTCTRCGACVAACPTGALFDKAQAFRGKLHTCRTVKTTCTECPLGCGLEVYTKEDRIVEVFGDPDSPLCQGHLCHKGRYETWAVPRQRITQPLLRDNGGLRAATWDEALAFVRRARASTPAWESALLLSPRLTNETAREIQAVADKLDRASVWVARHEAALAQAPEKPGDVPRQLAEADAFILLGVQPTRDHGLIAARVRVGVRKRRAKLVVLGCRHSDLDAYADIAVREVSLERSFWAKVADVLRAAERPVVVYGPDAMTAVGVATLERLIEALEKNPSGGSPALIGLPIGTNSLGVVAAGIEPVEEVAPWLDAKPLQFLHLVMGDEPDGGARLLEEKYVRPLLETVGCVVVQASYRSALTEHAHVVLPATTWAEKAGTVTGFDGVARTLTPVLPVRSLARDDAAIVKAVYA